MADPVYLANTTMFEHPAATQIAGLLEFSYRITESGKQLRGDGARPVDVAIDHAVEIQATLENEAAGLAFIQNATANAVVAYKTTAAVAREKTFKNVRPSGTNAQWPTRTVTQPGSVTVTGKCVWGAADTLATMIVDAAAG